MNPQGNPGASAAPSSMPPHELESDARWNQWADQGQRDHAAFVEKFRVLATAAVIAIGAGLLVWAGIAAF